jgi:hypothetical protein
MTEPRFSDDPVQHRARKELLVKLAANNRNPAVAELASELLTGKVTPRRIVESTLYSNVLEGATNDFTTWYSGLSDEEKDAAAARGEQTARDLADTPKPVQQRRSEDDEDFSDRSWLRG